MVSDWFHAAGIMGAGEDRGAWLEWWCSRQPRSDACQRWHQQPVDRPDNRTGGPGRYLRYVDARQASVADHDGDIRKLQCVCRLIWYLHTDGEECRAAR